MWRAVVASPDGNSVERHAIRFASETELVWMTHWRSPGTDSRNGNRLKFATTATGKLQVATTANLEGDGVTWTAVKGQLQNRPGLDYLVLPHEKNAESFSLVRTNNRGVKVWEATFRKDQDGLPAEPLVPQVLANIDRTIKKQPRYVNDPKYVLLVFGPEAAFRVWVVIDGDVVYIDRNGNGDLTEADERKELKEQEQNLVRQASMGLTYQLPGTKRTIANVWWFHDGPGRTSGFTGVFIDDGANAHISETAGGHELHYAPSPEEAAVIHFGSKIVTVRPSLSRTVERQWRHAVPDANGEAQLLFQVGTPGIGGGYKEDASGAFAAFTHMDASTRGEPSLVPAGVDPVAEFEFTPLNPAEKPKKVTVKLTERVGQTEFGGKITVPDGVRTGLDAAKITLSFPNCPWGKVEPVTMTMDVIPKK